MSIICQAVHRLEMPKAAPLTQINGRWGKRACSHARQNPFYWRIETRPNAQEMW